VAVQEEDHGTCVHLPGIERAPCDSYPLGVSVDGVTSKARDAPQASANSLESVDLTET
jgi:hypothetical protein